jgi:hypothetical protein
LRHRVKQFYPTSLGAQPSRGFLRDLPLGPQPVRPRVQFLHPQPRRPIIFLGRADQARENGLRARRPQSQGSEVAGRTRGSSPQVTGKEIDEAAQWFTASEISWRPPLRSRRLLMKSSGYIQVAVGGVRRPI